MNVKRQASRPSSAESKGKKKITSPILDLSNQGLEYLDEIFQTLLLPATSKITTLILTKNKISRLFHSFEEVLASQWTAPLIESIDIRDNNLEDVPYTVQEIQTTMPNVIDLKMNLYDEEHVDFIMRIMP